MPRGFSNPIVAGLRACTTCQVAKPLESFNRSNHAKSGRHPQCKECKTARSRARYAGDRERLAEDQRWRSTKWKYGITRAEYEELHAAQLGQCAICGAERDRLALDHDHTCCSGQKTCGKCLRGLLCFSCNSLLGMAEDNPDRLLAAVAYLRRWSPSL